MKRNPIPQPDRQTPRGMSYVLALGIVMLLGAMGMAMIHTAGSERHKGLNQRDGMNARLAAESGMAYTTEVLEDFQIAGTPTPSALLNALGTYYNSKLPSGSVSWNDTEVVLRNLGGGPAGSAFLARFAPGTAANQFLLTVTGQTGLAQRDVTMRFDLVPGGSGLFDKGIVSAGPIYVSGSAQIQGRNGAAESDVLSLSQDGIIFSLSSSCDLAGDIFTISDDPNCIDLSGAVTIAGIGRNDPAIWDHIHLGVESQELPRPDVSLFAPFAVHTIAAVPPAGSTLTNIRIPANMNPTFNDNTTLRGVIYIESPNIVRFSGNVSVAGVIVTDDPGPGATATNQIVFQGNASLQGVEALPPGPDFDAIRALAGSSLLAPGFEVTMTGSMGTVGGTLAAEKFILQGNASLTVQGLIMNLGTSPLSMGGSTFITIDRSHYDQIPPGFTVPSVLSAVPATYSEH